VVLGLLLCRLGVAQDAGNGEAVVNLLGNGDFAQGGRDWVVHPHMRVVQELDQQGNRVLLSESLPAPDDGYIHEVHTSQCINFGDARQFVLTAEFFYLHYPTELHAHRLNYTWFDEKLCTGGGNYGGYLEPQLRGGWQNLQEGAIKPALHSRSVLINLTHNRRASPRPMNVLQQAYAWIASNEGSNEARQLSSGYWDNISLVATAFAQQSQGGANSYVESTLPTGVNLLVNPQFIKDAEGWRKDLLTQWTGDQGLEIRGSLNVTRQSHEGSNGSMAFEQCVNINGQAKFEFGGFFMRDTSSSQTGGGRLRLAWYELPGCKGQFRMGNEQVDSRRIDGWQHLHRASNQAPPGVSSVIFEGIQSIDGPGEFSAYWDDVYLIVQ
jgi:hypothetical protein